MINITTMKTTKHEIQKSQWMEIINRRRESGKSIRQWCEENDILVSKFYYWQRVIREEGLIKAGTLAITGQPQFVELKPSMPELKPNNQSTCAFLRSNGNEIEILNGADPNTLRTLLNLIGKKGYENKIS
jgi:transposase-like protein